MKDFLDNIKESDKRMGVPEFEGWQERGIEANKKSESEGLNIPLVSNCYMADCLIQDSCMSFKTKQCNKDCKLYM